MVLAERLRTLIRRARRSNALWVRVFDEARQLGSGAGRARVWTQLRHHGELHQVTEYTEVDRYPALFDLVAHLHPGARRILSFGCSTGEEIEALRRRFPEATIVGAELNPRSRKAAHALLAQDALASVVPSYATERPFDIIFALAVLQFRPHVVQGSGITDLATLYPFARFADEVDRLIGHLMPGGLLCVMHAQYRVEDVPAGAKLKALPQSPLLPGPLFGRDSKLHESDRPAHALFVKRNDM